MLLTNAGKPLTLKGGVVMVEESRSALAKELLKRFKAGKIECLVEKKVPEKVDLKFYFSREALTASTYREALGPILEDIFSVLKERGLDCEWHMLMRGSNEGGRSPGCYLAVTLPDSRWAEAIRFQSNFGKMP